MSSSSAQLPWWLIAIASAGIGYFTKEYLDTYYKEKKELDFQEYEKRLRSRHPEITELELRERVSPTKKVIKDEEEIDI